MKLINESMISFPQHTRTDAQGEIEDNGTFVQDRHDVRHEARDDEMRTMVPV